MLKLLGLTLIISLVTSTYHIQSAASPEEQWLHDASGYKRALELQRELKCTTVIGAR